MLVRQSVSSAWLAHILQPMEPPVAAIVLLANTAHRGATMRRQIALNVLQGNTLSKKGHLLMYARIAILARLLALQGATQRRTALHARMERMQKEAD